MRGIGTMAAAGVAVALAGGAPAALAASYGWYARADAAYVELADNAWQSSSGPVTTSSKNGWGADFAVGNTFGPVWAGGALSGEFALTWKYNSVDKVSSGGAAFAAAGGHTRVVALMYNLIDEFRPDAVLDPYLGVGAGYAKLAFHQWGGPVAAYARRDAFAYQLLAGLKIRLSQAVNLNLGYTWFATTSPSFTNYAGQPTDTSYRAATFAIGVGWSF